MFLLRLCRQRLVVLALAITALLGLGAFAAPTALADVIPVVVIPAGTPSYPIDVTEACRLQYPSVPGITASSNLADPYSWVCSSAQQVSVGTNVGVSVQNGPPAGTFNYGTTTTGPVLGGVNLDTWCALKHPGTHAALDSPTASGWLCVEDMA